MGKNTEDVGGGHGGRAGEREAPSNHLSYTSEAQ